MGRYIVCLTFDFDAISSWIARNLTTPTPISRGEFAVVGTDRILRLLSKYDIKSTWFIPGHTVETYFDMCRYIHELGHEIGNHGYTHEPPASLSREVEEAHLLRTNEAIQRITGYRPKGYRSPSWDLSPHTIELLLKNGFIYDSSMMGNDYMPYYARQGDVITKYDPVKFGERTRLIEMPVSWSLDDFPVFEYLRMPNYVQPGLRGTADVLQNWIDDFRYMMEITDWGVITYTFHPEVIGRGHRMLMLERLIQTLKGLGAVFLRMDEAAEEFMRRVPFKGVGSKDE